MKGYFNHILGYLNCTRVMYHYQKSQECFQNKFLELNPRASSLYLSFRSPIWLHYWHFNYVTKSFPEMVIDWSSEEKTD